jgi:tetratricopeptide (TPR) repeat protein
MPDVAKLKKKAAELELKKQFDKALAVYVEILDSYEGSREEVDVALYNRVGDIHLKQGNVADAVDYYEKAVDHYVETGFYNNAIALCNKILRSSPGRNSIYYKLGKISAHKGFKGDAKANFLEYADRMQKAGQLNEAFRALKEFADLCPDQDDIRLMLADQLHKAKRGEEAIEQLQLAYERYMQEGRQAEADAAVVRMKAIDSLAVPRAPGKAPKRDTGDLVFLDLNDTPAARASGSYPAAGGLPFLTPAPAPPTPAPPPPRAAAAPAPPRPAPPAPAPVAPEPPAPEPEFVDLMPMEPAVLDGLTSRQGYDQLDDAPSTGLLDGLQTTNQDSDSGFSESGSLLDLDTIDFGTAESNVSPIAGAGGGLLDFDMVPEAPREPAARPPKPPPKPAPPARPPAAQPPRAAQPPHPSLNDLPLIEDEGNPASPALDDAQDDAPVGGDLELIMPDQVTFDRGHAAKPAKPARPSKPTDDIPLMDLESPIRRGPVSSPAPAPAPLEVEMEPVLEASSTGIDGVEVGDQSLAEGESPEAEAEPSAAPRASTIKAAHSVEVLQSIVQSDPEDHGLRRRLAEALLDAGDREGGLRELEAAMLGFERADNLDAASSLVDEIVRLNPGSVRHHQKRVEYAFRRNERGTLIEAYLQLADALFRAGTLDKSRAIYQRVLDLAPDDVRAQSALEAFPAPEPEPPPPPPAQKGRVPTVATGAARPAVRPAAPVAAPVAATSDDEFVNLGDWLRGDDVQKNTRMVVEEQEPTGDEEADFQDMLRKFKQGIAENIDDEDHQSHYDLGVAYKEMGLLDEAIAEFQKALRSPTNRVPTYEALGQAFMEKEQYQMAATILGRALNEKGVSDEQLVGVLYLLGRCAEERGQHDAAVDYYQRVFVVDIQFRDVGDRLVALEGARR